MSPDNKGNDSIAIRIDSLYGKEETISGGTRQVIDSCITTLLPMATLGLFLKVFDRV